MSDVEKTVFISYRRSTSKYLARAIYEHLKVHNFDVFLDVETIDSGEFDRIILGQIAARAHFVVLLSVGALERCIEPEDWMRREIEFAIEKQRNIVPLLVDEFTFSSTEKYLSGRLTELPKFNALKLYYDYFDEGMGRLVSRFLKQPLYGQIVKPTSADQTAANHRIEQMTAHPVPTEEELGAEEYFNRAYKKDAEGDFEGAIADYSEAIRLDPKLANAYNNRANARAANSDLSGAIADCNQAILLKPTNADFYDSRGDIRKAMGDLLGAIEDYEKSFALDSHEATRQEVKQKIIDLKKQLGR